MTASLIQRVVRAGAIFAALSFLLVAAPVAAQDAGSRNGADMTRFKRPGKADIVIPPMDPARGRIYFASRGCVVCHKVNGIGGTLAPELDAYGDSRDVDILGFVTGMWRGARSMVALQELLFSENIDLSPEELASIIAFIDDAGERRKFSENDIPKFIRDFMAAQKGAPLTMPQR